MEEENEIPCHFLCPISIEMMMDPVTVSTGITYDRHSIEKWLSSSKTPTCPVTKQPLNPAAALTPNLTLRRLIHSWPKPSPEKTNLSDSDLKSLFNNNTDIHKTLIQLLRTGDLSSRESAITLLKRAYAVADPIHLIGAGKEVFVEVVRMIKEGVLRKQAVAVAVELLPWGRNRVKAVEAGAVAALVEMLVESGGERRECEVGMAALEQVCRCAEGRAELLRHGAGLAVVSKKILRVSGAVSDRGVRIVGLVARYSASARVLEEMVEVGVVAKMCLALQVVASHRTKERVREILKLHSRVWKGSSCIPPNLISFYPS